MSTATLNIKLSPRRILTEREAADYCGLPAKKFSHFCRVSPVQLPGVNVRYDIRDLDEWLDGMKSGLPNGDDDIIGKLGK
jgi:hypothetical protein